MQSQRERWWEGKGNGVGNMVVVETVETITNTADPQLGDGGMGWAAGGG